MANEILVKQGVSKTWCNTGGDYALGLATLASTKGRMGAKIDLGTTFAARYAMELNCQFNVAPTAGGTVEVYWAPSTDNANFPGGVTGGDAAYKDSEEDEWKKQLVLVLPSVVTNDANTDCQQVGVFSPGARYGAPVVMNEADQALNAIGNTTINVLTITPLIDEVQA